MIRIIFDYQEYSEPILFIVETKGGGNSMLTVGHTMRGLSNLSERNESVLHCLLPLAYFPFFPCLPSLCLLKSITGHKVITINVLKYS